MSSSLSTEISEIAAYLGVCYSKDVAQEAARTVVYWAMKQHKTGTSVSEEDRWTVACTIAARIAGRKIVDARAAYYAPAKKIRDTV